MRPRFALACLIAALAQASPQAWAAPKASKGQAAKPSAEQLKLTRQAQAAHAQAARLDGEIAQLKAQLIQLGAVEAGGEQAAQDKKTRLDQLNAQESALTARVGSSRAVIARLIGALELYRRNPPPAFLVYPSSAKDAVRAQILARAIAPELQSESRALADQIEQVRRLRRVVDAASEDLFRSESELADQRARIEALIDQKTTLERQLNGGADQAQAALTALANKAGAPGELIDRLPPPAAQGPAPTGFISPVQGLLLSRFGQQTDKGRAQGFSWRAAPGAPVLAPVAGTVEYAGPLKGYGVVLILAVGGAYHLVLAGLQAASETTGQSVAAGEPIGRMADDAASPTDLYLEVRRDGEPVDPARWLKTAHR
jgi:septal ring factor EnvC (AmiA/AmiB activator)